VQGKRHVLAFVIKRVTVYARQEWPEENDQKVMQICLGCRDRMKEGTKSEEMK
jgi:hypothetical protein